MNWIKCLVFGSMLLAVQFKMLSQEEINLYPNGVPNAIEDKEYQEEAEVKDGKVIKVYKVSKPTLTVFRPEKSNGTAVIICPGGGYGYLSFDKEGIQPAKWLNEHGVTALVLKYRLPHDGIMEDKSFGPLQDVQQAIRYVRTHANELHIDENKIGIMGFSAGGHLAASASTLYNEVVYEEGTVPLKPDFSILVYPVISMEEGVTHKGSKTNLLGENPSKEEVEKFSTDEQINAQTPPAFLVHATDDGAVPVENSLRYYSSLVENNISAELHVYNQGGHGFGLKGRGSSAGWTKALENWLKDFGLCD
ncbi:alpha/beta hydrolase [Mangrovimonas xylaniphaga]|uniref:alpha/beta hydrolase n=1 Tax=Mangrovimonas xylaniphaga TaxID=1645915 RepID=UPI0006B5BD7C|nr:alpha/beta hydrolase [Mangrovimonas xylaniphaga]